MRLLKAGDVVRAKAPRIGECVWTVEEASLSLPQNTVARHPQLGALRFEWLGYIGRAPKSKLRIHFYREGPEPMAAPAPRSVWRHTNGNLYRVLHITNLAHVSPDYPPHVVYCTLRTPEHVWSRPLSDWLRSFTEDKGESP